MDEMCAGMRAGMRSYLGYRTFWVQAVEGGEGWTAERCAKETRAWTHGGTGRGGEQAVQDR